MQIIQRKHLRFSSSFQSKRALGHWFCLALLQKSMMFSPSRLLLG